MPKISNMTYNDMIKILKNHGFIFYRQGKGSHELRVREFDKKVIPIPKHGGTTMKIGTVKAVLKEVGIGESEL